MSVKLFPETKIFVACPANFASGGPEILHQLVYHLINDLKVDAYMYYFNYDKNMFKTPVHPDYEMYNVPYVLKIDDKDDDKINILIVPEVIETLLLLPKYKKIRKGVWFLSVDYYYISKYRYFNKSKKGSSFSDIYLEYKLEKLAKKYDYRNDDLLKLANFYINNSYRGMLWFKDLEPNYYLPDYYINLKFIEESVNVELSKKENIVVYNPKKGFFFTKKIIDFDKSIQFIPIENMKREEVIKTLRKAKVYIDFGFFPGPERIPKEAAMMGCCVITGKRGSAAFFEDVSIPDKYKFEDKEENIPKIVKKIKDCFENFEERYKDFDYYRQVIRNGPKRFIEDLKNIFQY
ncbi:MAG: hypothetical protein ACK4J2_05110 [Sulfurihydrogenibium azorense]|uniref:hypothetical protein n=1 Tax=Sulfurihydrogenibium azorense TaxID=309806 RepID=UPI00391ABDFA